MHSDIFDQVSNEEILKIFVANKPRVLEFGGSIIKALNYFFLLILRPYHVSAREYPYHVLAREYPYREI